MPTVLIADHEPSLRRLLRTTIRSDQYAVLEAADGHAAWRLIEAHRPAVVLMDVIMPGRDGLELTRAIRATPALAETRVILMTAEGQPERRAAGAAAGADVYLDRPFSPLQLLESIHRLLGLSGLLLTVGPRGGVPSTPA